MNVIVGVPTFIYVTQSPYICFLYNDFRTDDVAKAFLKAIEEDHNGESLFIPSEDIVMAEDSHARFRREVLGMEGDAAQHFKGLADLVAGKAPTPDK